MASGDAPIKIVQIETRYVQTDAHNFKDVVQSLTGKNSTMADWIEHSAPSTAGNINKGGIAHHFHGGRVSAKAPEEQVAKNINNSLPNMHNNNLSFKDFDGLMSDLPPIEELLW